MLAHAAGLHGIQLLSVLAPLSDTGRLRPRGAATVLAVPALGYTAAFAAITATAYAGRAPYDPAVPLGILLAAGVLTTGTAAAVVLAQAFPARRTPDRAPEEEEKTPLPERTGR
ncbi:MULTISPECIES: hypothetical protein [Streptomyces]|uniref:Uncharacterized protein n=1 Tax=Streptomyces bottropensis ATCC 25435 TaxID=1054862 RepID=M3FI92_9ACTN|nr:MULTISPECIES: hypothetical protein [Streptomyces]EMF51724.1 hypothetical protein SBD_6246 [Streptomyces bottropensis ATCC 25435]MZD22193.1 hypothetical protein [Streptomyces sp. SID5476]